MNSEEKLVITRQLLRLNVDVIEAGFPVSSPGDFKSVQQIAAEVGDRAVVCALSRAVEKDIDSAARALAECKSKPVHAPPAASKMGRSPASASSMSSAFPLILPMP